MLMTFFSSWPNFINLAAFLAAEIFWRVFGSGKKFDISGYSVAAGRSELR